MTALLIVGVLLLLFALTMVCLKPWDSGASDDGEPGSDGGGGSRRPARPGSPGGGAGEPGWWPQFEREFAAYVSARDRGTVSSPPSHGEMSAAPHSGWGCPDR